MKSALALAFANFGGGPPAIPPMVAAHYLPLKQGFYAPEAMGCSTGGQYSRYSKLLKVQPDRLNDTGHERRLVAMLHGGPYYHLTLDSKDLKEDGRPERLDWYVTVGGPTRFYLSLGYDRGVNWTGYYTYCGTAIP